MKTIFFLFLTLTSLKASADASCDDKMLADYKARQLCLIDADVQACAAVMFLSTATVGALGGFAGSYWSKFQENLDPSEKASFGKVLEGVKRTLAGAATSEALNAIKIKYAKLIDAKESEAQRADGDYRFANSRTSGPRDQGELEYIIKFRERAEAARRAASELAKQRDQEIKEFLAEKSAKTRGAALRGTATGIGFNLVASAVILFGPSVVSNRLDEHRLYSCQNKLGLSEGEIKFLAGYTFSKVNRSSNHATNECDEIALADPIKTIDEAKAKFGTIPPGICKIMQNEAKWLDNLIGDSKVNSSSCKEFSAPNVDLTFENAINHYTFKFYQAGSTIIAPMNTITQYPDFNLAEILDSKGAVDSTRTKEFRHSYYMSHLEGEEVLTPTKRPELVDIKSCAKQDTGFFSSREAKSPTDCVMVQAALKARIASAARQELCFSEDGQRSGGSSKPSRAN